MTLDGVAEDVAPLLTEEEDAHVDAACAALIASQDVVVLGRRTYDAWDPFWPTSDFEPFASFIKAEPKHVATSAHCRVSGRTRTPSTARWSRSFVS